MIRQVIHIDEEKCNGCGVCAEACHEGAIGIVEGKAKLMRDDYCDGLGDCLPTCPTGAISFVQREAAAYDEEAVKAHQQKKEAQRQAAADSTKETLPCGCPGTQSRRIVREKAQVGECAAGSEQSGQRQAAEVCQMPVQSQLMQWPVQIKLAPVNAPYFDNANLLIAADCTAYAYGDFHNQFIKNRVTLIGCPKLDSVDYSEKLTEIIRNNEIKSVTIVRMEVPCCGGIEHAVKQALQASGRMIPWQVVTISTDGRILE